MLAVVTSGEPRSLGLARWIARKGGTTRHGPNARETIEWYPLPGPWALAMSTIHVQLRSLHKAYCACVASRADHPAALQK